MRKLYLDIDGVILTKRNTRQADYLPKFLDFIINSFDCYWLTTHCKGDHTNAIRYLSQYLDKSLLEKLEFVKPTDWVTLKTEAIDIKNNFLWLEDSPMQAELNYLKSHGRLKNIIIVDLNRKNELEEIVKATIS